uniref:Chromo domain-containing protein n=1 Tax=Spongospora subterranea TaxID=70186 RepID=A0A0H5RAF8_9EUKA|eukprot:CRZ10776.1 hypothetical protein [Spongospora subterranea]
MVVEITLQSPPHGILKAPDTPKSHQKQVRFDVPQNEQEDDSSKMTAIKKQYQVRRGKNRRLPVGFKRSSVDPEYLALQNASLAMAPSPPSQLGKRARVSTTPVHSRAKRMQLLASVSNDHHRVGDALKPAPALLDTKEYSRRSPVPRQLVFGGTHFSVDVPESGCGKEIANMTPPHVTHRLETRPTSPFGTAPAVQPSPASGDSLAATVPPPDHCILDNYDHDYCKPDLVVSENELFNVDMDEITTNRIIPKATDDILPVFDICSAELPGNKGAAAFSEQGSPSYLDQKFESQPTVNQSNLDPVVRQDFHSSECQTDSPTVSSRSAQTNIVETVATSMQVDYCDVFAFLTGTATASRADVEVQTDQEEIGSPSQPRVESSNSRRDESAPEFVVCTNISSNAVNPGSVKHSGTLLHTKSGEERQDEANQIDRIIAVRLEECGESFLVRWCDRGPEHDSWELESDICNFQSNLDELLAMFESRRAKSRIEIGVIDSLPSPLINLKQSTVVGVFSGRRSEPFWLFEIGSDVSLGLRDEETQVKGFYLVRDSRNHSLFSLHRVKKNFNTIVMANILLDGECPISIEYTAQKENMVKIHKKSLKMLHDAVSALP